MLDGKSLIKLRKSGGWNFRFERAIRHKSRRIRNGAHELTCYYTASMSDLALLLGNLPFIDEFTIEY